MIPIRKETVWNFLYNFFLDFIHRRTIFRSIQSRFYAISIYKCFFYNVENGKVVAFKRRLNDIPYQVIDVEYKNHYVTCKRCNKKLSKDNVQSSLMINTCILCGKRLSLIYMTDNDIRVKKIKSFL